MNKSNKISMLLVAIGIILTVILAVALAYYDIEKNNNENINMNINSPGDRDMKVYGTGSVNMIVDALNMMGSDTDTVAYESDKGFVIQTNNNLGGSLETCTYDYVWTWDADSDPFVALASNELTIGGPFAEMPIPDYNARSLKTVLASGSSSAAEISYDIARIEVKFRSLATIDQSSRLNKNYHGEISIENIACTSGSSSGYPGDKTIAISDFLDVTSSKSKFTDNYSYVEDNMLVDYGNYDVRFIGSNPNNYIYFNCSDYSNQNSETCNIYRIVGVFDEGTTKVNGTKLVKIINTSTPITSEKYNEWFSGPLTHAVYANLYLDTTTMLYLNPAEYIIDLGYGHYTINNNVIDYDTNSQSFNIGGFYNGNLTYDYVLGSGTLNTYDLTGYSIKNDKTRNMIREVMIPLANDIPGNNTIKDVYSSERLGTVYKSATDIYYPVKVLIPYYSDYLLAAYSSNNWIHTIYEDLNVNCIFTMSMVATDSSYIINDIEYDINNINSELGAIIDAEYLDENVILKGGSGTLSDPYQIDLN